jgi:hydrogenase maturation protein HypF
MEPSVMPRRLVLVRGTVQGVGFRPFVFALACRFGLHGCVSNQTADVRIEVEGESAALDQFVAELATRPPPLARIDSVQSWPQVPRGESTFRIETSGGAPGQPLFVPADVATCADCLRELFDPADRRFRYPFLNCTNCGPRLTIMRALPYDRERTVMAAFAMCPACEAEYHDPANRRFHAQPTCCPACGPRLQIDDAQGRPVASAEPLGDAASALRAGQIVAIKGLGGYHLACDAANFSAVAELRRRKARDEKPFALMVADLEAAETLCEITEAERRLLQAPQRPIVLLRRRPGTPLAPAVALGNPLLGIMLPYTPLHHVLLRELAGVTLVMTSGNRADEPIAYDDQDARKRLTGIADWFLGHDRPIQLRCDDSVTRVVAGVELPLRRSRGHTPQPLRLPRACPCPILALGGQLKATFALGQEKLAILSHHMGDLEHYEALRAHGEAIEHYERLFAVKAELIVHDLHPDYASTRYALARAATRDIRTLAVQHHHAHLASCLADNGLDEPVIGVIFDGTGYGTDGAIWGGEFLVGDYHGFRRAAHLRYVAMPGGQQAIHEPWRMAAAYLLDAGLAPPPLRVGNGRLGKVQQLIERRINTPLTSSVGRLFDAVAALAGVRQRVSYEGQAAVELEWGALEVEADGSYPFELAERECGPWQVDTRPLIGAVLADLDRGQGPARIARRFHATLTEIIVQTCQRIRGQSGLNAVVLSGGVFMNALLLTEADRQLADAGFRVHRHSQVPPNDGGLCLGQLAIAAAQAGQENHAGREADHVSWHSR